MLPEDTTPNAAPNFSALAALFTLHFQAPGFYLKQGCEIAATLEAPPPGATRFLMRKKLV